MERCGRPGNRSARLCGRGVNRSSPLALKCAIVIAATAVALASCKRDKDSAALASGKAAAPRDEDFAALDLRLDCCEAGHARPECRAAFARLPPERLETCPAAQELDPTRSHPLEERLCGFTATPEERRRSAAALGKRAASVARGHRCRRAGRKAALEAAIASPADACGDAGCFVLVVPVDFSVTADDAVRLGRALGGPALLSALDKVSGVGEIPRAALLDGVWPGMGPGLAMLMGHGVVREADIAPLLTGDAAPLRLLRARHERARLVLAARQLEVLSPDELERALATFPCALILAVREPLRLTVQRHSRLIRCVEPGLPDYSQLPPRPRLEPPGYVRQPRLKLPPLPREAMDVNALPPAYRDAARSLLDPKNRKPSDAVADCTRRIHGCNDPRVPGRNLDACVISAEECKTDRPWAEPLCCPKECVAAYEARRRAGAEPMVALQTAFYDQEDPCFPGVKQERRGAPLPGPR